MVRRHQTQIWIYVSATIEICFRSTPRLPTPLPSPPSPSPPLPSTHTRVRLSYDIGGKNVLSTATQAHEHCAFGKAGVSRRAPSRRTFIDDPFNGLQTKRNVGMVYFADGKAGQGQV